jgi:hypothetical protein
VLPHREYAGMNHEQELIKAFFAKPKNRKKFLLELSHFKALDPRYCFTLPKVEHTAEQIAALLTRKGAPPSYAVISENFRLDGKEMSILQALRELVGYQMGTFLSCVPGQLAYFEDEDGRWILERSR